MLHLANSFEMAINCPLGCFPSRESGQPLPEVLRSEMEAFFGANLSGVRVFVGRHVERFGAVAFTAGSGVHFAPGLYDPSSREKLGLLAHELTHVLQQSQFTWSDADCSQVAVLQDARLEEEADRVRSMWENPAHSVGKPSVSTIKADARRQRVLVQRAIRIEGASYSVTQAAELIGDTLSNLRPDNLLQQVLTRFDFANRSFPNLQKFLEEVTKVALEEATEIALPPSLQWEPGPYAQFKKIFTTTVSNVKVGLFKASGKGGGDLVREAALLEQLKMAGLRVVPVYGAPKQTGEGVVMLERWIDGNFIDVKEGFTEKQQTAIAASLFGMTMPTRESEAHLAKATVTKIMKKYSSGERPPLLAIDTLIGDFKKIEQFQTNFYISDLQGIVELTTGKFYIADPLALLEKNAVDNPAEKRAMEAADKFVETMLGYLAHVREDALQTLLKKAKSQTIPKLPPPPGSRQLQL